jgi:hypothetical protein
VDQLLHILQSATSIICDGIRCAVPRLVLGFGYCGDVCRRKEWIASFDWIGRA